MRPDHYKTVQKFVISMAVASLISCGGGGGGGGGGSAPGVTFFQTPVEVDSFQPLVGSGSAFPIFDIFAADLNKDGVDEVILAGRKTQPATAMTWQNFNMQIYGWNTGSFANETSSWFSGSDNIIIGTEPAVKFGDFDGDTNIDVAVAAGTDMSDLLADTLVFFNNGDDTFTRSTVQAATTWSHDMWVHDFDGNGRDDILVSDYGPNTTLFFGNADDTFTAHGAGNAGLSASGVSVGDYIPGGAVEVGLTDNGPSAIDDTELFTWSVVNPAVAGTLTLTNSGVAMPGSLYTQMESDASIYSAHAIRNVPFNFDGDADIDMVVFERLDAVSEVQFLENDGAGNFTDVTGTVRVNYDTTNGGVNYQPTIQDLNGDGLEDIFLSGNDFDGMDNATQVLVQSSDGKYVGSFGNVFSLFTDTIQAITSDKGNFVFPSGMNQHIVKGPMDEYYLVGTSFWLGGDSNGKVSTFIAKLGAMTARAPQTAIELQNNVWPYPQ